MSVRFVAACTRQRSQQPCVGRMIAKPTSTPARWCADGTGLPSNEPEPVQHRVAQRMGEVLHEHPTLQALVPDLSR